MNRLYHNKLWLREKYEDEKLSIRQVAKLARTSTSVIHSWLRRFEIPTRTANKDKYSFNSNAFDAIKAETTAYWLGFLYSDACVYQNSLRLDLKERDEDHLEKFKKFLDSNHKIYPHEREGFGVVTRKALLVIGSKNMASRLKKLGIVPDRTMLNETIRAIPKDLVRHFIRGILDGDGSVRKKSPSFRFVGKPDLLKWIKKEISTAVTGTNPSLEPTKSEKVKALEFHGLYLAKRVAHYLYRDATVWMDRKKDIVNSWSLPKEDFLIRQRDEKGRYV